MSGPCFCDFGLDDRRQRVHAFEVLLIEVGLHQLDAEVSFDLQNELEHVDGIDFQFPAEQRLIVAQILGSQVGDPQAIQYDGLELLLYTRHIVVYETVGYHKAQPEEGDIPFLIVGRS
jgi:hypothetical protein